MEKKMSGILKNARGGRGRGYPPRSGPTAGVGAGGGYTASPAGGFATTTVAAGYTTSYVSSPQYTSNNTTDSKSALGATTPSTKFEPPVVKPETAMEVDSSDGAPTQGKKRKPFPFTKRPKRPKLEPKNPVLLLNELKPGLAYELISSEGPTHDCTYKYSIKVNDISYEGSGVSKREAKYKAAENALKAQIELKDNDIWQKLAKRVTNTPQDQEPPEHVDNDQLYRLIETEPSASATTIQGPREKHPVMLLNEYAEKVLTYECVNEEATGGKRRYTMKVAVNGENFEGQARNQKAAKAQAARLALAKLFNVFVPESDVASTGMSIVKDSVTMLGELHRTPLYYEMVENSGAGGTRNIVMKVTVNGTPFDGKGNTKKQAKSKAAQAALAHMYGLNGEVPMSDIGGVSLFRSPITVLQHYHGPQTAYELSEGAVGQKSVTASVTVSGEKFTGTGESNKAAKCAAARAALSKVYNINIPSDELRPLIAPPKALAKRSLVRPPFMGLAGAFPPFHPAPGFFGGFGYSGYTSFSNFTAPVPQQLNQMIPPKARMALPTTVKPPTQVLLDMHKNTLTYECIGEEGPVHAKVYTMVVNVNGAPYEGTGKSKKEAKWNAARSALEQVYKIKQDTFPMSINGSEKAASAVSTMAPTPSMAQAHFTEMHPVMLLNQLSGVKHDYTCISEEGPVNDRVYTMEVKSGDKVFHGKACNKKDAKAAAARNALAAVYNVQQSSPMTVA